MDWRLHLAALACFSALTVIVTWPLVKVAHHAVLGWVGDNFYFAWLFHWFGEAAGRLNPHPLWTPRLNWPGGASLAYNETCPAMVALGLPFWAVGGEALGYNASIFLSFVLSGMAVYWWIWRLTGRFDAALLAGALFAFIPYRQVHMLGHLNLMGTQWLPLYFMALHGLLAKKSRRGWKDSAWVAVTLCLIALTSLYYLYMSILLGLVYVGAHFALIEPEVPVSRVTWRRLGVTALASGLLLWPLVQPYVSVAREAGDTLRYTRTDASIFAALPSDYFTPPPGGPIWRHLLGPSSRGYLWLDAMLYLGAVTMVWAAVAVHRRWRMGRTGRLICIFALMGLVSFLLSLGRDPQAISFDPWPLGGGALRAVQPPLPLFPSEYLARALPFYDGIRVWMRYGIFTILFACLLAGLGAASWLERRRPATRAAVTVFCIVLAMAEMYAGPHMTSELEGRPVDRWLAAQPGKGAVVRVPIWQSIRPEEVYYTLTHGKPLVGGFFGKTAPPSFSKRIRKLCYFPEAKALRHMKWIGVRYVLVDPKDYKDYVAAKNKMLELGLKFEGTFGEIDVYQIPPGAKKKKK